MMHAALARLNAAIYTRIVGVMTKTLTMWETYLKYMYVYLYYGWLKYTDLKILNIGKQTLKQ